jgi:hypothetical protein
MKKNTWSDVLLVIDFTCILFTVIIVGSFFGKLAQGQSTLPLIFIGQSLIYTLILTLGLILCFTDLILRTKSITLRIVSVGVAIYIISLLYLKECPINPFKNLVIFMVYSVLFISFTFLISQVFCMYQKYRVSRYSECITQFQNQLNNQRKG